MGGRLRGRGGRVLERRERGVFWYREEGEGQGVIVARWETSIHLEGFEHWNSENER
jgi:hypothetical protein